MQGAEKAALIAWMASCSCWWCCQGSQTAGGGGDSRRPWQHHQHEQKEHPSDQGRQPISFRFI